MIELLKDGFELCGDPRHVKGYRRVLPFPTAGMVGKLNIEYTLTRLFNTCRLIVVDQIKNYRGCTTIRTAGETASNLL